MRLVKISPNLEEGFSNSSRVRGRVASEVIVNGRAAIYGALVDFVFMIHSENCPRPDWIRWASLRLTRAFSLALFVCFLRCIEAADWPQYRGPNFDGSSPETILTAWPSDGPKRIWRQPLDGGFSSLVFAKGKLCTLTLRLVDGVKMETCVALDADSGKPLWSKPLGVAKYTGVGDDSGNSGAPGNRGGDGPRSTPSLDGSRVYITSSKLRLFCLNAENGEVVWIKDLIREHAGTSIPYENAAAPVLDGNLVFVGAGGPGQSLLAIDKYDGKVVWKRHDEKLTHSTPTVAVINGIRQVIFFTHSGLVAVTPETGDILWRYPFRFRVSAAISPVVAQEMVYCSAGYGVGSAACELAPTQKGFRVMEKWRQPRNEPVANAWSTPVHRNGYLFGMFGFKKYGTAPMKCVELATGAVKWSQPGFGHGNVIVVGDHLLALTGYGVLTLIRPSPDRYTEIARAKVLTGKCWSMPIVANGRIYARSTTEAVALDVSPATPDRYKEHATSIVP
jgi:outer membrane protein assembly factor BamB